MARGRHALGRDDYVAAAVRYTDAHGSDALTLRSLGDSLGVAHTALYRHFHDKADLVAAMTNHILREATELPLDPSAPPEERLMQMARNVRTVFLNHPHVAIATSGLSRPGRTDVTMTAVVVGILEEMGVPESHLAACYQALESFVIGSQAYDLSGAPDHLELRRQRHRVLGHPAFDDISRSSAAISANNDAAFELGLRAIVRVCAELGRSVAADRQH